jgi:putative glutamine amidotransferase
VVRPLVAVTTTLIPRAGAHRRPQIILYADYQSVLEARGLTTVLITPAASQASIERILDVCDGLLLTGGEDVDPARYGEAPIPELGATSAARDAMEFAALQHALELDLPVLGICRGCQVMNVALGGTLYQDLTVQRPGDLLHQQQEPWGLRTHLVQVAGDSHLGRILGPAEMLINSFHHQGIRELAPPLRPTAIAADGLIEAVELPDREWVVGVQWHPERYEATLPETDPDRRLLDTFAEVTYAAAVRGA